MPKGGYAQIKRGPRTDLILPDDPKPIRYDSGWMADIERWFIYLMGQGGIIGYESEWIAGERGAQRFNFLTNSAGNGSIGIDFKATLPRMRRFILPIFDVVWDEPRPHGRGCFDIWIEVKGLLNHGGLLRDITDADLEQLKKAERGGGGREDSALKLRRMREKYPRKIVWVVGGREYKAIKDRYKQYIPTWEG
jgi:hypothetical protein